MPGHHVISSSSELGESSALVQRPVIVFLVTLVASAQHVA